MTQINEERSMTLNHMVKFLSDPDNRRQLLIKRKTKDDPELYIPEIVAADFVLADCKTKLSDAIKNLTNDVVNNNCKLDDTLSKMGNEIKEANNNLDFLRSDVRDTQTNIQTFTSKLEEVEGDLHKVGSQTLDTHNESKKQAVELENIKKNVDFFIDNNIITQYNMEQMDLETSRVKSLATQNKHDISCLSEEVHKFDVKLCELEKYVSKDQNVSKDSLTSLQTRVDETEEKIKMSIMMRQELNSTTDDVNELKARVQVQENDIQDIRKTITRNCEDIFEVATSLVSDTAKSESNLFQLKEEVEENHERISVVSDTTQLIKKRLEHYNERLDSLEEGFEAQEDKIHISKTIEEKMKERLTKLEKHTNEKLDQLSSTMEEMKSTLTSWVDKVENSTINNMITFNQEVKKLQEIVHPCSETIKNVLSPGILGLATDIKNMKEEYNGDLIRMERDCTNRIDALAADLIFKMNDSNSSILEQKIELDGLKNVVEDISKDIVFTKQMIETGVIIAD